MDWLIEEFLEETGIDLRPDRMALQRLKEAAERAKSELSTVEEAKINLPFVSVDDEGPRHLSRELTREKFESLVADLVERTVEPCEDALRQAGLKPKDVDEVLLVGGQSRSPCIFRKVQEIFQQLPKRDLNPDEVVAIGAAIQGGILKGNIKDIVLLDVTPLSLGIETQGGIFTKQIERNSTIPTKTSQIFTTVVDNQDSVEIHILQGERDIATENRSLGRIELVGIPPAPRGRSADRSDLRHRLEQYSHRFCAGSRHRPIPDHRDQPCQRSLRKRSAAARRGGGRALPRGSYATGREEAARPGGGAALHQRKGLRAVFRVSA